MNIPEINNDNTQKTDKNIKIKSKDPKKKDNVKLSNKINLNENLNKN